MRNIKATRRAKLTFAILAIAAVQTWLAMNSFGTAFARAEGRGSVSSLLMGAVYILGFPALIIAPFFGNGAGIYFAFGIGGLVWGIAVVLAVEAVKRRKRRLSPNAR